MLSCARRDTFKTGVLDGPPRRSPLRRSSVVERATVNRLVVSSNLTAGANSHPTGDAISLPYEITIPTPRSRRCGRPSSCAWSSKPRTTRPPSTSTVMSWDYPRRPSTRARGMKRRASRSCRQGERRSNSRNPAQKRMIDDVEVGRQVAPRLRIAFEVADARSATHAAVEGGAELVAEPTETPWRSLNARLDAPASLHVTLFEELDPPA